MASIAQSLPVSSGRFQWLWGWLRDELIPYPGRALLVARMVIAATLGMIICMTFQISYAWQGAIYALLVSRESPRATVKSAATLFLVTAIGAAYIIASMRLYINNPPLHFVWVIATLFLAYYAISTLTNYLASVAFVNTISFAIPLWDRHVSAETNVEDTLRLCLATFIGAVVTAGVELVFVRLRREDEVVSQIAERLSAVGNLLTCVADGCVVDAVTEEKIIRLEMLGTSLQRRLLRRSNYSPQHFANMTGFVALVGRLVDLAASLMQLRFEPSATDKRRFRSLAAALASIRDNLTNRRISSPIQFDTDGQSAVPLLGEMERTVALISEVFAGSRPADEYLPSPDDLPRPTLLSRDAFVNPEHFRFAQKGCLAASGSYVIYNAIAWPGISTAVTTCLLTALTTAGASHQKQILRLTGAIVGGFVIGMGSQVFILPHLDSIGAFTVLFILVTALSAWFLTSSPRLSYFGVQVALAFYLINLEGFKIQISLAVARDRVVGILLGLFMMWFVFDRLWGAPAAVEMKRTFISNLRMMAQFTREPLSRDLRIAISRSLALRETINADLDKARAFADGVLFEFGPSRQRDLELRDQIRRWQPQLRAIFVLRIVSWRYRAHLPGFELPESVRLRHQAYDDHSAHMLEEMAGRIERNAPQAANSIEESHELLNRMEEEIRAEEPAHLPPERAASFVGLLRKIDALTISLASEIAAEFGAPPTPPFRPA
jgi:multidrug resistance protein MdtO